MLGTTVDISTFAPLIAVLSAMGVFLKRIFDYIGREAARHEAIQEAAAKRYGAEVKDQREQFLDSLKQQQVRQEAFLGSHMADNALAMKEVAEQFRELRTEVRRGRSNVG